ncbi:response regulator [candidate division TA06 bacterium]|uniref:Response regulator n=1 Tax=candidate division TA06 bacterium TaxID=2250710 RepID=A0A523XEK4_UNCT6|nr:MAG: response regulator [candidate division TA06 bacterium]
MKKSGKRILWVDDEIEALSSHVYLLEGRGYEVSTATNGDDGVSLLKSESFDLILLDQMMPGMDGITTLAELRRLDSNVPIVMVTKSEEESLMDEAFGRDVADFLVKPINPRQLISTCKRILEKRHMIEERMPQDYASDFNKISQMRLSSPDWSDWVDIYSWLCEWDVWMDRFKDEGLGKTHAGQKKDCNSDFCKYVSSEYTSWVSGKEGPLLSPHIFKEHVFPRLRKNRQVVFLLLDCMRLDQYLSIEPLLKQSFNIKRNFYYSILPSATPYARNAIFSGLFPVEMSRHHPQFWSTKGEGSQNRYEREFLELALKKEMLRPRGFEYVKVLNAKDTEKLAENLPHLLNNQLLCIVVNFVDILTHYRSESTVVTQMTADEDALRSFTHTWFARSRIYELLGRIARKDVDVILTSDHGSIQGERPCTIYGGREISSNLRYKFGSSIRCDEKQALVIKDPVEYMLPTDVPNKRYCIAKEDYYFVYPTHYQRYVKQYRGTFQHGGISMEEMILPVCTLTSE